MGGVLRVGATVHWRCELLYRRQFSSPPPAASVTTTLYNWPVGFFPPAFSLSLLVSILHADIYHLLSLTRLLKYRHHQVHHCRFSHIVHCPLPIAHCPLPIDFRFDISFGCDFD